MSRNYDLYGKCETCAKSPPHAVQCHNAFGTCQYFYYNLGDNTQELYEPKKENEHVEAQNQIQQD